MMGICLLTVGGLIAAADGPDPAGWVRRLGSDRFAERVEAARALEGLGPAALPALRAAKDSENPRIRARVAALLETLDRAEDLGRLTRPTLVTLDFRDRPLADVIEQLNARHGLGLTFHFGPLPTRGMMGLPARNSKEVESLARRITLVADRPVPFWQAIDRLCEAGQLQHDLHPQEGFGLTTGKFHLFAGLAEGTSISSDSGPFRVRITGLHSTFLRDFVGDAGSGGGTPGSPARPPGNGDLTLRMAVVPQPGLVVRQVGPSKFDEAVDDRGRGLLPRPEEIAADYQAQIQHQVPNLNVFSGFGASISLRLPDRSGRSIRRLRGSIPVMVVAYSCHPIVIPLEGAAGKLYRNDEATVSVIEVDRNDNAGVTVEVEVTPNAAAPPEYVPRPANGVPDLATLRMGQSSLQDRLELYDAAGRELALSWNQGRGRDWRASQGRIRLTPMALPDDSPPDLAGRFQRRAARKPVPVELRYYGLVQTVAAISFEFRDIPLP